MEGNIPAALLIGGARAGRIGRGTAIAATLVALQACTGTDRVTLPGAASPAAVSGQPVPPGNAYARRPFGVWTPTDDRSGRPPATILYGDGQLVRATAASRTVELTPEGDVLVAFVDADVREVARTLLGEVLGLGYAVDPDVQGTITLQTSRPMPRDALIDALEFALAANDAALVEADGIFRILPRAKAPVQARMARTFPGGQPLRPGYGVHVVPLQFVSAEQMRDLIMPIAGEETFLQADRSRNLILLGAPGREAEGLIDTIAMLDVDWLAGMSFGYFPVHFSNARLLAEDLEATLANPETTPVGGMLRFVPLERLNTILAISPQPRYLAVAEDWIRRLDQAGEDNVPRLFVYHVENGRASELAAVLGRILAAGAPGGEGAGGGALTAGSVAPGLTPVELRIPAEGGAVDGAANGTAAALVAAGTRQSAAAVSGASLTGGSSGIRIVADEANNALVVYATKRDFRLVRQALERLDLVPLQVLIEATIAEVTLNDELQYGIEWFFRSGKSSVTFSSLESGLVQSAFPGFSYLLGGSDVRAALNALTAVTDVKVISSPHLMVLNNRTAGLQVGDRVPVAVQSAVGVSDGSAPIVNSIELVDTGVILNVTPRVNPGGLVTMEIEQQVSDAIPTVTSGIDSPTIQQRRIMSTVAIESGNTIALGGLIRDNQRQGRRGIPLLSDIPVVGRAFSVNTSTGSRTELMVLLTPRVVRDQHEARAVTAELQQRLRAVAPLRARIE